LKNPKTIIIGAGIGGLMTAIAFNKKGIECSIYEKTSSIENVGAGLGLWPNATSILDKFGLLKNLLAKGNVLHEIQTSTSSGKKLNTVRLKKLEDKFHFPSLVISRSYLQNELLNAVPPSQIHFNKKFVRCENKNNFTEVVFQDGTSETCDVLIFADGIHSHARKDIFNFPDLNYAGRTSWRGIAHFDKPVFENKTNYEIYGKGKRVGIFPLPNNSAYWFAAVNMSEEIASQQKRTHESLLSHFANWAEPVHALIKNTPEEKLVLTKIFHDNNIHQLVKGNFVLLGDAAHPITPDLGQGACQAIEDAFVLTECFSKNNSIAENLAAYETKRLPRVKMIARNSFRLGNVRQWENPIAIAGRNLAMKMMPEKFALKMLERNIGNRTIS